MKTSKIKENFKNRLQGFVIGLVIAVIFGGITVYASVGQKTLDVSYNNIRVVVDGELIVPQDANGKEVEPFIADGTTYLPVRAIANALGKDISWDGDTQTVYIGQRPDQITKCRRNAPAFRRVGYKAANLFLRFLLNF